MPPPTTQESSALLASSSRRPLSTTAADLEAGLANGELPRHYSSTSRSRNVAASSNGVGSGSGNGGNLLLGKGKHNRRDSNTFHRSMSNGFGGIRDNKSSSTMVSSTTLCIAVLALMGICSFGLVSWSLKHGPSSGVPSTDPPSSDSPGPHVVIPININYTLPPPTNLPRNQAYPPLPYSHGAVAAEDITCSQMGVDVLKEGGNSMDAAVVTCICVGVLNSFSSGIGGGGFMVIRVPPEKYYHINDTTTSSPLPWSTHHLSSPSFTSLNSSSHIVSLDFRESSPSASHPEMYSTNPSPGSGRKAAVQGASQVGGLSVGVPGELKGLWEGWKRYGSGRISWERLFQPNVDMARGGWRVSRELARRFRVFGAFMVDVPEWSEVYRPRGAMLVEGDWVQRTKYADTLEWIGKNGIEGFYGSAKKVEDVLSMSDDQQAVISQGKNKVSPNWIAEAMIAKIQEEGGIMTIQDLQDYQVRIYDAISSTYHGNTIYTTDAPSSGPVMLGMFNALEGFNLSLPDPETPDVEQIEKTRTGLNVHRITEAMKFAFGARAQISDPAEGLMEDERRKRVKSFGKKAWGEAVRRNITDDTTHTAGYYTEFDAPMDSGTTHMSTVDQWGGAVSLTSTVNLIFGSRVMDPITGIILNDEQDDFSIPGKINAFGLAPSPYNYPEANKRPLSSTSATIVERPNGELYVALGGSGGSRIFGAVAQTVLNLEWGMDIGEAIEAPRLHDQLFPALVTVETGFEFTDDLKERNHNVTAFDINLGVAEVQAVLRHTNGTFFAASDSRKHGWAWGY